MANQLDLFQNIDENLKKDFSIFRESRLITNPKAKLYIDAKDLVVDKEDSKVAISGKGVDSLYKGIRQATYRAKAKVENAKDKIISDLKKKNREKSYTINLLKAKVKRLDKKGGDDSLSKAAKDLLEIIRRESTAKNNDLQNKLSIELSKNFNLNNKVSKLEHKVLILEEENRKLNSLLEGIRELVKKEMEK